METLWGVRPSAWVYRISIVLVPVVAIGGVLGTLWIGAFNLVVLGLYLAVPMVLAPVIAWRYAGRQGRPSFGVRTIDWRVISSLFHVLLSALVIVVATFDVRPLGFYVGVAVVYGLLFLLASSTEGRSGTVVCLYHVVVALLLVVFSVTLKYELFVGHTDVTAHVSFVQTILESGGTSPISPTYEPFALWHIYAVETYAVLGGWVRPHTAMFLLGGLVFAAGVPATYSLTNRLYRNRTVSVLSCLMVVCVPLYIFYGMYSIPRSAASILFLVLLLALAIRSPARSRAVSVALVTAIVLYHPVSIPFVAVILSMLYVVERVFDTRVLVDNFVLASTVLLTAVYWLYRADYLVSRLVGTIVLMFTAPPETAPGSIDADPWIELANFVPYSFLVFFVLLGFLFWTRNTRSSGAGYVSFAIVTIGLIPLALPGPTLLLDSLAGVNVVRFGHYSFMFFGVVAGIGVYELLRRGGLRMAVVLLLVVSCFAFTAVSNDYVASDNPVVERTFYTYYLTEQERTSFERLETLSDGPIAADRVSCRHINQIQLAGCERAVVGDGEELFAGYEGVLIREHENEKRPLQFSRYVSAEEVANSGLTERTRAYDSGAVSFHVDA